MDSPRVSSKPELVVLGRSAPEENVLCSCKTQPCGGYAGYGKRNRHTNCCEPSYQYHAS
jgi:hypothetical protein